LKSPFCSPLQRAWGYQPDDSSSGETTLTKTSPERRSRLWSAVCLAARRGVCLAGPLPSQDGKLLKTLQVGDLALHLVALVQAGAKLSDGQWQVLALNA
jgi:hypothetical protein